MSHLGDTNKMVETPRTYLQDRLLSMVHAFHDDQRKYAVRLLANDVADLENELNAAQQRIKRLEEARTVAAANSLATMMSYEDAIAKIKRLEESGDAHLEWVPVSFQAAWRKAKEAKL